jgi:hypothetical protein
MLRKAQSWAMLLLPVILAGCSTTGPNRPLSSSARAQVRTVTVAIRNYYPDRTYFPQELNQSGGKRKRAETETSPWVSSGAALERENQVRRILDRYKLIDTAMREAFLEEVRKIPYVVYIDDPRGYGVKIDAEFVLEIPVFGFKDQEWPLYSDKKVPYMRGTALLIANPPYELRLSPNVADEHRVTRDPALNPILWKNKVHVNASDKGVDASVHTLSEYLQEPELLRENVRKMARKMARDMVAPLLKE